MATTAKIARTDIPGEVPNVSDTSNTSYIEPGALFINVSDQLLYSSNGADYFIISGTGGATANITVTSQTFTGTGANTSFILSKPTTNLETFVFLNGVAQVPTTDYAISGTTLSFVVAPPSDNEIEVRTLSIQDINGVDITLSGFTGNSTNTVFTLATALGSNSSTFVYLNGVAQIPAVDYSVANTTLTFTTAPPTSQQIRAVTISAIGDYTSDIFNANSTVNNNFVLSTPTVTTKAIVFINGVAQVPSQDYFVSGYNLFLSANASIGDVIQVRTLYEEPSATGPNTAVQFNGSGVLKGTQGLTFNESTNTLSVSNTMSVSNFKIAASNPPANNASAGETGMIAWDSSYIYVCISTNTWKRAAIATWP